MQSVCDQCSHTQMKRQPTHVIHVCVNKYMMWTMNDLRTRVHITSRLLSKYIKEHVDISLASHRDRSGSVLMKVNSFYRHAAFSRRVQCGIIDRE